MVVSLAVGVCVVRFRIEKIKSGIEQLKISLEKFESDRDKFQTIIQKVVRNNEVMKRNDQKVDEKLDLIGDRMHDHVLLITGIKNIAEDADLQRFTLQFLANRLHMEFHKGDIEDVERVEDGDGSHVLKIRMMLRSDKEKILEKSQTLRFQRSSEFEIKEEN